MVNKDTMRDWWETHLESPTIGIALLFLATLLAPYTYHFSIHTKNNIKDLQIIFWALFSLEYAIRVILTPDKWYFIKRHPIDFLIVFLPPIQFLRFLKSIALTAYFIRKARSLFFRRNSWFLITMAPLVIAVSSVSIYEVETGVKGANIKTFNDSVWWAITTMSTVGYGDKYPITNAGKVIATLTIIAGVSLIGMLTAEIAVIFIGSRAEEEDNDKENVEVLMVKLESMEQEIKAIRKAQEGK